MPEPNEQQQAIDAKLQAQFVEAVRNDNYAAATKLLATNKGKINPHVNITDPLGVSMPASFYIVKSAAYDAKKERNPTGIFGFMRKGAGEQRAKTIERNAGVLLQNINAVGKGIDCTTPAEVDGKNVNFKEYAKSQLDQKNKNGALNYQVRSVLTQQVRKAEARALEAGRATVSADPADQVLNNRAVTMTPGQKVYGAQQQSLITIQAKSSLVNAISVKNSDARSEALESHRQNMVKLPNGAAPIDYLDTGVYENTNGKSCTINCTGAGSGRGTSFKASAQDQNVILSCDSNFSRQEPSQQERIIRRMVETMMFDPSFDGELELNSKSPNDPLVQMATQHANAVAPYLNVDVSVKVNGKQVSGPHVEQQQQSRPSGPSGP